MTSADLRQMAISEFAAWHREQTNKLDRPFQEHTITNYTDAAKSLHRWMTTKKIGGLHRVRHGNAEPVLH